MPELHRNIPPIVMTSDTSILPHAYRLVITTTHCRGCGSLNETSELYQIGTLRSRVMNKPGVTNAIATDRFLWNVPLQIRYTMRVKSQPVCHKCFQSADLSHLPTVPGPEPEIMNTCGGGQEATEPSSKRKLTVDDL